MTETRTYRWLKGRFEPRLAALRARPWWELAGLAAIVVLTAFMYTWALSRNGMGNTYYAAAVKSGSLSWKAFLFGSLDAGNFITVDKTPASFWLPEVFARVFGFSSWSILLPQALAGIASVLILYRLVRRWRGEVPALIAALVFALTPVVLLMFRYNNPDAILTLLLLLATWAFWSALEKESGWRLAGAGALIGFAFLTKMLEAFVVLPAFVIVYLVCAKPRFGRRMLHLGGALLAMVVAGGWWVLLAELWPAASRPYIGGSTDNSVLDLILSRTAGYTSGSGIDGSGAAGLGGGGGAGGGPNFAGSTGWLRIFNEQLGGQISWLLPFALVGLLAGLWVTRRRPRTDLGRAGYLLWGLWTVVIVLVFSFAGGVLHPYYSIVIGPGLGALVGAGGVALWRLGRDHPRFSWLLPAAVVGSALWSASLLRRTPDFAPGLSTAVIVLGAVGAAAILVTQLWNRAPRALAMAAGVTAAVIAGAALLAGPFAYDLSTISHSVTGPLAAAGPVSGADGFGPGGGASRVFDGADAGGDATAAADAGLVAYLEANKGSAQYLVAVEGANAATPLILATDQPVMAMGGFNGGDPAPTLEEFKDMVTAGEVRYVLIGGNGNLNRDGNPSGSTTPYGSATEAPDASQALPAASYGPPPGAITGGYPAGGGQGPGGQGAALAIEQYVLQIGTAVPADEYGGASGGGTLYYLGD